MKYKKGGVFMPRMTKKEREAWDFFINSATGRKNYNALCKVCSHSCKQSYRTYLVACPRFTKNSGRK